MEKLGIQPILILAQVVNFVIILLLLKKFLYKPIIKVLDERKKKAEETDELHDQANKKLAEATDNGKKTAAQAKKEADKIIAQAKIEAQKEKEELLKKGQKELDAMRKKLESDIEADKKEMLKEIKKQSTEMAILIAEKVMQESLDHNKQKNLINQALKDLEKVSLN